MIVADIARLTQRGLRSARMWLVACALLAGGVACGGRADPVAPPVVEPRPSLPVLTAMTIILTADTAPASETIFARVEAVDERSRPMTVGLIAWTSDDPAIATVSSSGAVLARSPGTTKIRAQVGDVVAERVMRVTPPPPGPLPIATLTVSPFARDLDLGATEQLVAVPRDFAGNALANREITWTSSDTTIAVISMDGVVTARAAGAAIVEASSEGQRGATAITVRAPLDTSIQVQVSAPVAGAVLEDSVSVIATVRSLAPLDSVVLTISGRSFPMQVTLVGGAGIQQPTWTVTADISTLVFGPIALVVTATDNTGRRGVQVVPVIRNPRVPGGNKNPPGSK